MRILRYWWNDGNGPDHTVESNDGCFDRRDSQKESTPSSSPPSSSDDEKGFFQKIKEVLTATHRGNHPDEIDGS